MPALHPDSEAAFQLRVVNLARFHGWRDYHPPENLPTKARSGRVYKQATRRGFPDLTLCHDELHRLVFAELKSETGRVRPEQVTWLELLGKIRAWDIAETGRSSIEVYLWRPSDWNAIQEVLGRG